MNDVLPNYRATDSCLSAWAIARIACGDVAPDAGQSQHLADCARCAARLAEGQQEVVAGATLAVPPSLLRAASPSSTRRPWVGLSLVVAAAAAILAILSPMDRSDPPRDPPYLGRKGDVPVRVSVERRGVVVADDVSPNEVQPVPGDRMRLHVGAGAWTQLEALADNGAWVSFYEGPRPVDGWLPVGIEITAGSDTVLRVTSCPSPGADRMPNEGGCSHRILRYE